MIGNLKIGLYNGHNACGITKGLEMNNRKSRNFFKCLSLFAIALVFTSFPAFAVNSLTEKQAYAKEPFQTLSPLQATLTPPIGDVIRPYPTPYPGLMAIGGAILNYNLQRGDPAFGYGKIAEYPQLVMTWITVNGNQYYLVMDRNSDDFLGYSVRDGDGNPTGERLNDGFLYYVTERANKLAQYKLSQAAEEGSKIVGIGGGAALFLCLISGWGAMPCTTLFIFGGGGAGNAYREDKIGDALLDQIELLEEPMIGIFNEYCPECFE